jgi:DNA-binding CsgD family transcriptional regulator
VWTLALRGGARVAVVAAEWCDAFGVVTRGRVQLELRDGEPGPVLGRDAGALQLTVSERRVADLAAEERSNPEIAQALFVTRKTVETHLGHVYHKLGVPGHGQLARALAEQTPTAGC